MIDLAAAWDDWGMLVNLVKQLDALLVAQRGKCAWCAARVVRPSYGVPRRRTARLRSWWVAREGAYRKMALCNSCACVLDQGGAPPAGWTEPLEVEL